MVMLAIGISGQTSVAPIRGCSPLCLLISINSPAFFMARKAASITASGTPTKVTTVRLVALPGSTFSNRTPSTDSTASVICLMMFRFTPSLKLGTHSISFIILDWVEHINFACAELQIPQNKQVLTCLDDIIFHDNHCIDILVNEPACRLL